MSWLRKSGLSKPAIFSSSNRTGQQSQSGSVNASESTCSSNLLDSSTSLQAAISPSTLPTTSAINTTNEVTSPPPPSTTLSDGSSTLNCNLDPKQMTPESTKCVSSTATTATSNTGSNNINSTTTTSDGTLSSFASGIFSGAGVSLRRDTNSHSTTGVQQQQQQQHQSTMSLLLPSTSAAFASGSFFLPGRRRATSSSMVTNNCLSKSSNLIDSQAALDSFKTHWFQAWDVMKRKFIPPGSTSVISSSNSRSSSVKSSKKNTGATESDLPSFSSTSNGIQVGQNETNASSSSSSSHDSSFIHFNSSNSHKSVITSDDVTSIINHLDQMIQLLIQESKGLTSTSTTSNCTNVNNSSTSSSLNEQQSVNSVIATTGECDSILTIDTSNSLNGNFTDPLVTQSMVSPLLDCLLFESMLDKLLTWSVDAGEFASTMKLHQLKLYHILVTQICPTKALLTKPIIRPMMQLLVTCSDCLPVEVEKAFVTLLNALCQLLCQNEHLIDLFFIRNPEQNAQFVNPSKGFKGDNDTFTSPDAILVTSDANGTATTTDSSSSSSSATASSTVTKGSGCKDDISMMKSDLNNATTHQHHLSYISPTIKPSENSSPQIRAKIAWISDKPEARFLLFSLLIPYVHREGLIGSEARNGLLALLSLSKKFNSVAQYIADESNFCPVLATGLSGLYSSLPRKIYSANLDSEWYQITFNDINQSPELKQFLSSFDFCNTVIDVSAKSIAKQLIEFILHGFLISVIAPALHQDTLNVPVDVLEQSSKYTNSLEELIATTSYVDLFLRHITQPDLLYTFLKFLCTESFDDVKLLSTLITRINGTSKLALVTLVLFRTMLDMCCEDVTLELILKYLLQCRHVSKSDLTKQINRMDDVIHYEVSCGKFLSLIPTYDELRGHQLGNSNSSCIHFYDSYYESLDESLDCNRDECNASLATNNSDHCSSNDLITSGSVSLMFHQMTSQLNDETKSITSASTNCSKITSLTDSSFIFNKLLIQNYTEYLIDASSVINELKMKCSYWVNLYDSQFILETINYLTEKNSSSILNSNGKFNRKLSHGSTGNKVTVDCKDADEEEFAINESTSPPPTIDSPSSSSETTCTDSGVFVNLNSNTSSSCASSGQHQIHHQQQQQQPQQQVNNNDNLQIKSTMNNESSTLLAQSKVTCANNYQPTQLTLAKKVNIESSSVPLISSSSSSSSPQPLISSTSNCSTIILSPFTTTTCRVTPLDTCRSKNYSFLTVDDDTNNASGNLVKNCPSIITTESASIDETSSSISDVTLMINHRNSSNCSPVTSVDELHSMNHESCAYNSSGTGSTNGQITCDINLISSDTSDQSSIIGPFLMAILTKLETMIDADLVTNLQLTGIISHLSCYPVPLLRSFFLSSLVSYQNGVKTFQNSLEIARNRIISETSKLNQSKFDSILCTSRCYLMSRDSNDMKGSNLNCRANNSTTCTSNLQLLNRYNINLNDSFSSIDSFETSMSSKSSTLNGPTNRRKSLKDFLFRSKASTKITNSINDLHDDQGLTCPVHGHLFQSTQSNSQNTKNSKTPKAPILESLNAGTGYRYINRASYDSNSSKESEVAVRTFASGRDQKIMLAALVFEEFLKEISAICHEHSIALATTNYPQQNNLFSHISSSLD